MPTEETVPFQRHAEPLRPGFHVTACVDPSGLAAVVPHARAIAEALDASLTLLHVVEAWPAGEMRPDPIEWDLRRHEARRALGRLASSGQQPLAGTSAEVALAEGPTADEICRYSAKGGEGLIVLGTRGRGGERHNRIGGTAHNVLNRAPGSILLVPVEAGAGSPGYRRIVVPVDGSCWAESVLPLAVRIAKAHDAELVLAHVVPAPELTGTRPFEPEDLQLRLRVIERNERAARDYLERIRARLADMGLRVRVLSLRGDDVRIALAGLIEAEGADLVVLSARGHGSSRHGDMRYGSVASYLIAHAAVPLLIVQPASAGIQAFPQREPGRGRLPLASSA